jgi:hypothetical protein
MFNVYVPFPVRVAPPPQKKSSLQGDSMRGANGRSELVLDKRDRKSPLKGNLRRCEDWACHSDNKIQRSFS